MLSTVEFHSRRARRARARRVAARALDTALRRVGPHLAPAVAAGARVSRQHGDAWTDAGYLLDRPQWRVDGVRVALALRWRSADLLDPDGITWPYVGILVEGGGPLRREFELRLPVALRAGAAALRWDLNDRGWPWWRWVRPTAVGADPAKVPAEALTAEAVAALLAGWATLSGPIDDLLPESPLRAGRGGVPVWR